MECSPSSTPNKYGSNTSCFSRDALIRIVDAINKKYPNKSISYTKLSPDKFLWDSINYTLSDVCKNNEQCWLEQNVINNNNSLKSYLEKYYKPKKPEGKYAWLSTTDINSVLKQFEDKFKEFKFMGAVPIDFDEFFIEYQKLDICSLKSRGITKIGCVFNLDKHNERGSHWVSLFANIDTSKDGDPFIGYFDSVGTCPPPKEIQTLMYRLAKQINDCLNIKIKLKCNSFQHQKSSSECGVYSIYFIFKCLENESFEGITTNKISDEKINKMRDFFFRGDTRSSNHHA
jgi:hypothetical protein